MSHLGCCKHCVFIASLCSTISSDAGSLKPEARASGCVLSAYWGTLRGLQSARTTYDRMAGRHIGGSVRVTVREKCGSVMVHGRWKGVDDEWEDVAR